MNELTGAVGCVQLGRLEGMLAQMRCAKARLREVLVQIAQRRHMRLRELSDAAGDTAVALTVFLETPEIADRIADSLTAEHIGNFRYYRPGRPDLHVYCCWLPIMERRPLSANGGPWCFASRAIEYAPEMCPRALDLLSRSVEISISPRFSETDIEDIVCRMRKVFLRYAT